MSHASHVTNRLETGPSGQAHSVNKHDRYQRTITSRIIGFIRRVQASLVDRLIGAVSRGSDLSADYAVRMRARLSAAPITLHECRPTGAVASAEVGSAKVLRLDDFRHVSPHRVAALARLRADR